MSTRRHPALFSPARCLSEQRKVDAVYKVYHLRQDCMIQTGQLASERHHCSIFEVCQDWVIGAMEVYVRRRRQNLPP